MSAFEKFFEEKWPRHAATIKMYEEKSPAVDYMDAMIPIKTRQIAKDVWNAALEHAAKMCEQHGQTLGAICAAEVRKEIEK